MITRLRKISPVRLCLMVTLFTISSLAQTNTEKDRFVADITTRLSGVVSDAKSRSKARLGLARAEENSARTEAENSSVAVAKLEQEAIDFQNFSSALHSINNPVVASLYGQVTGRYRSTQNLLNQARQRLSAASSRFEDSQRTRTRSEEEARRLADEGNSDLLKLRDLVSKYLAGRSTATWTSLLGEIQVSAEKYRANSSVEVETSPGVAVKYQRLGSTETTSLTGRSATLPIGFYYFAIERNGQAVSERKLWSITKPREVVRIEERQ